MDVILLQRIEKLGQMGEMVKVKPGFARNYLLPQRKAIRATEENRARFEKQRAQLEANNLARRQEAEKISGKVDGLKVVIIRQAGEAGILYGSISARDIAQAATAAGVTIDRGQVLMDRPIKMLGLHPVRVALHPEVIVSISANVAKSAEEAVAQETTGGFVPAATEAGPSVDELIAEADRAATGADETAAEPAPKIEAEMEPKAAKEKKPRKAKAEAAPADAEIEDDGKAKAKKKGKKKTEE